MCVIGRASARPGIGSIRAREPVLITTTSPRRVRVPPSAVATSIVFGPTKRPCPMTSSAPLSRYLSMIQGDHPIDHLPLAVADGGHLDFPVARGDPELGAPAEIAGDLRAVDQVLAREARDAGAGPRDIPPLDDRRPLPLRGQRPGEEPAPPAAEHHQVVFLGI